MLNKILSVPLVCLKCNLNLPESLLVDLEWVGGHYSYECSCGEFILSLSFFENTLNHPIIFLQYPAIRILGGHAIVFEKEAILNVINSINLKDHGIEENDTIFFINYTPSISPDKVKNFRTLLQANGNAMFFNETPKQFDFFPFGTLSNEESKNISFTYSLFVVFMKGIEIADYSFFLLSRAFNDLYNNQYDRLLKEVVSSIEMNLKGIINFYGLDQFVFGGQKKRRPFWSKDTQDAISNFIQNRPWPSEQLMRDGILKFTNPRATITHEGFKSISREDACKVLASGFLIHIWQKCVKQTIE